MNNKSAPIKIIKPSIALMAVALTLLLFLGACRKQMQSPPPPPMPPEPWSIANNNLNSVPAYLSNGFFGIRPSAAGLGADSNGASTPFFFAKGYQDGNIVEAPNILRIALSIGNTRLYPQEGMPFMQRLNMKAGVLLTEWTQKVRNARITVKTTIWLSRADEHFAGAEFEITSDRNVSLSVETGPVSSQNTVFTLMPLENKEGSISAEVQLPLNKENPATQKWIFSANATISGEGSWTSINTASVWNGRLTSNTPVKGAVLASISNQPILKTDYQTAYNRHLAAWETLWQGDIVIEGDPYAQQLIRSWLFHLYSSAPSKPYSIPPMGLSNKLYNGHIFWDADIWMFSALMPLAPNLAKSIPEYRLRTLGLAKQYAKKTGYQGARYPWEGDPDGIERAPNPFTDELHITADAMLGIYESAKWQGRPLNNLELDALKATADFWLSAAHYNKKIDKYEIKRVISPDEGEFVDNDLYTNVIAKWNLLTANALHPKPNPNWKRVADRLKLPYDAKNGIYMTYDNDEQKLYKQAAALLVIYPLRYPLIEKERMKMLEFYAPKTNRAGPAMSQAIDAIIAAQLGLSDKAWNNFVDSYSDFTRQNWLGFNETRKSASDKTYFCTGAGGCLQTVLYGFAGMHLVSADDIWIQSKDLEGIAPSASKKINDKLTLVIKPNLPSHWKRLQLLGVQIAGKVYNIDINHEHISIESSFNH